MNNILKQNKLRLRYYYYYCYYYFHIQQVDYINCGGGLFRNVQTVYILYISTTERAINKKATVIRSLISCHHLF